MEFFRPIAFAAVLFLGTACSPQTRSVQSSGEWPVGGQNSAATRNNPDERTIGPSNAGRLTTRWSAKTHGAVSATPAVVDDAVYVPDDGGYFTKFDARTGRVIWSRRVTEYTGEQGSYSRTSPAVDGDTVYIGDHYGLHATGKVPKVTSTASRLLAVDVRTGALKWSTVLDTQFASWVTQSPMVHDGVVYQGIASGEEDQAAGPKYDCCKFRGSLVAVSVRTHKVLWRTYFVPENKGRSGGYSGAAVWSGTPAIDPVHGTVIVTTGNNYSIPASAEKCRKAGRSPEDCFPRDNYIDSIVALDRRTGAVRWATGHRIWDTWTSGCLPGAPPQNCPPGKSPDADFGDGAHVVRTGRPGNERVLVGAGQKSGMYWQLDAATGKVVWRSAPGPSGQKGGIQWGSAADGRRVYVAEANFDKRPYTLPDGRRIDYGSLAALDVSTGRVLWQTPDPSRGWMMAAVTVANGVLYAGSTTGHMYAVDAATGKVLKDLPGEGTSMAGPAVAGGLVYWGNGYQADWATMARRFYVFGPSGG
ncbi:outer membrane protein assembly factor BamB family protein [Actinomadura macra]|uniref:outer membrane protein assembly factor BamB family protein n=1 Tax=Actinomadura macra TaxID=46164 RepID=UPI000832B737|nr:PQQ-binding-like beta-propeller repeat protein [Actinomadura macra]